MFAHSDVISRYTIKALYKCIIHSFIHCMTTSDDTRQLINFFSEFIPTLFVPFAVLGTPTKGYQKNGTVHYFGTIHKFWKWT